MRGNDDDVEKSEKMDDCNFIFWYGCPPNSDVKAVSNISVELFDVLKNHANPEDGSLILPGTMKYWSPEDGGQMIHKFQKPLQLVYANWDKKRQINNFEIVSEKNDREEEDGTLRKRCNRKRLIIILAILLTALTILLVLTFTVFTKEPQENNRERITIEEVLEEVQVEEVLPEESAPVVEL